MGPPGSVEIPDRVGPILAAIRQLPDPGRQAILLYLDNLSAEQIADRLGIPPDAARDRLRAGLEQVRQALAAG